MCGLVVAGEAIFALPFHLTRFFRPTVLDVFGLTNTELGAAQGIYGILAMLSYFVGGPLADRFAARKLLAMSLWTTAAGGLYMATFPDYRGATLLWGFYGVTTILFFWAALIKATREWGGMDQQGRAYGLLDAGRGALAAVFASLAVGVFSVVFPDNPSLATLADKEQALRIVIYGYTALTAVAGLFIWFAVAEPETPEDDSLRLLASNRQTGALSRLSRVLRIPAVWLQAAIVVCAYVGYKGFDNYSLYAVEGYGFSDVEAARIVTIASWARPVAALGVGLLGDRYGVVRLTTLCFLLLLASQLYFALFSPAPGLQWVLLGNTLLTCTAIFGLRGLYFALFEEAKVPAAVTRYGGRHRIGHRFHARRVCRLRWRHAAGPLAGTRRPPGLFPVPRNLCRAGPACEHCAQKTVKARASNSTGNAGPRVVACGRPPTGSAPSSRRFRRVDLPPGLRACRCRRSGAFHRSPVTTVDRGRCPGCSGTPQQNGARRFDRS